MMKKKRKLPWIKFDDQSKAINNTVGNKPKTNSSEYSEIIQHNICSTTTNMVLYHTIVNNNNDAKEDLKRDGFDNFKSFFDPAGGNVATTSYKNSNDLVFYQEKVFSGGTTTPGCKHHFSNEVDAMDHLSDRGRELIDSGYESVNDLDTYFGGNSYEDNN